MQKEILELAGEIVKAQSLVSKLQLSIEDLNSRYFLECGESKDVHYLAYYFDDAKTRNEIAYDYIMQLNESMKELEALCDALYVSVRGEVAA